METEPLRALSNSYHPTDTDYALKQSSKKIMFLLEKEEPAFTGFG